MALKTQGDIDCINALNNIVFEIEKAGGVTFRKSLVASVDPCNLASAYIKACDALGLAPLINGKRQQNPPAAGAKTAIVYGPATIPAPSKPKSKICPCGIYRDDCKYHKD